MSITASGRRSLDRLVVMTSADLRARYGRGGWRLFKWILDPFALVGVYLLLVSFIFYRRPQAGGLSIACAIIPFQLVLMTVTNSLDAVRGRRSIVANMRFPRVLLPVATVLTETLGFVWSLALLALLMAVYDVAPTTALLWLPVFLALTVILSVAVAFPTTLLGLWAPDLRGILLSFVRAAYFLAPGLVTLAAIHGRTQDLVKLNPLTGLFEGMRSAVLYGSSPPLWTVAYPLIASVLILAIFFPIYLREQAHFAKVLE